MERSWVWRVAALAVVGLAIGGAVLFASRGDDDSDAQTAAELGPVDGTRAEEGEPAPDFVLESLDGELVQLSSFSGKPVLVNFWASWCEPCKSEMPEFEARYQELGGDFVVVAVNVDDSLEGATGFQEEFGMTFPVVIDHTGDVKDAYRVGNGLPKSYFIDADGILQSVVTGEVKADRLAEELAGLGLPVEGS